MTSKDLNFYEYKTIEKLIKKMQFYTENETKYASNV
jgi:hypothetical protein